MLKITIGGDEHFNEVTNKFETVNSITVELEHSLFSLSKWESKYQKPFLTVKEEKTREEIFDYVRSMLVNPDVDPDVLYLCSPENIDEIQKYIDSPQSATTFGSMPGRRGPSEVITSELIYYWMVMFNIPPEYQHWHINRLFALIRICNIKQSKPKKMTKNEVAQRNRELNAQRKAELGTSG